MSYLKGLRTVKVLMILSGKQEAPKGAFYLSKQSAMQAITYWPCSLTLSQLIC